MATQTMLDVLEREEGKESVKYVLDKAYEDLADAAGVSVETFKLALNMIVMEGYFGYYPEEPTIGFSEAHEILKKARAKSSLEDYSFFCTFYDWNEEDKDGNPLPNAIVTAQEQLNYIFSAYREVYGGLP